MNPCVPEPAAETTFDVEELFVGDDDDLLWLTLGFASPAEPLDVLHIVCGKTATGLADEDALYLERTDQDLACSGQVLALTASKTTLALRLTAEGAAALRLPTHTRFTFNENPALFAQAAVQLAQMAACGQACIAVHEADGDPA